jgi:hypothetical protein
MDTKFTRSRATHKILKMKATSGILLLLATQALSKPSCNLKSFTYPIIDGMEVTSLEATQHENWSSPVIGTLPSFSGINFCEVKLHVTHHGTNDDVAIHVWLPIKREDWNSRFQATGGGGWATGVEFFNLAPAILGGYAGVSTDGGHPFTSTTDMQWAFNSDRTIDWNL